MADTVLYYAHDPMCSYCYAFKKTWGELKSQLPKSIKIISILGGLAPDNDAPMAQEMQEKLIHTWHSIESRFGVEFNFDFWEKNTPRRSTYPACRAVLVAKKYDLENQMIKSIQNAYYLNAQNPADIEVLTDCAKSININPDDFIIKIKSTDINQELIGEINKSHELGLNSFPSLLLSHNGNHTKIPVDYVDYQPMLNTINLSN